ncbi:unnamed protein product, partial [Amoebophrya sp. A25]|eukprot:GSA25T00027897001.1
MTESWSAPPIGSRISLITDHDIRYVGVLVRLNEKEGTVAVKDVRSLGTEGRKHPGVPMSMDILDRIVFQLKRLKHL